LYPVVTCTNLAPYLARCRRVSPTLLKKASSSSPPGAGRSWTSGGRFDRRIRMKDWLHSATDRFLYLVIHEKLLAANDLLAGNRGGYVLLKLKQNSRRCEESPDLRKRNLIPPGIGSRYLLLIRLFARLS